MDNPERLIKNGWQKIEKNDCYAVYLNYLKIVNSSFYNTELYKLEMSLFADAENLAMSFLSAHE